MLKLCVSKDYPGLEYKQKDRQLTIVFPPRDAAVHLAACLGLKYRLERVLVALVFIAVRMILASIPRAATRQGASPA